MPESAFRSNRTIEPTFTRNVLPSSGVAMVSVKVAEGAGLAGLGKLGGAALGLGGSGVTVGLGRGGVVDVGGGGDAAGLGVGGAVVGVGGTGKASPTLAAVEGAGSVGAAEGAWLAGAAPAEVLALELPPHAASAAAKITARSPLPRDHHHGFEGADGVRAGLARAADRTLGGADLRGAGSNGLEGAQGHTLRGGRCRIGNRLQDGRIGLRQLPVLHAFGRLERDPHDLPDAQVERLADIRHGDGGGGGRRCRGRRTAPAAGGEEDGQNKATGELHTIRT